MSEINVFHRTDWIEKNAHTNVSGVADVRDIFFPDRFLPSRFHDVLSMCRWLIILARTGHMGLTTSLSDTNQLLDSLPKEERGLFLADCETVNLEFGQMLAEPGKRFSHALFPIDCFVFLVASLKSGGRLEVSMAGNEGMVGISLLLGSEKSSLQAVVQGSGPALRMSSACFQNHLEWSPVLEKLMKRYLNVMMCQLSQSAACAHFHQLEARLARALLMAHDRIRGDQLHLTHAYLSAMLGVRREGVTVAANVLQRRGLIDYCRGRITVNDRLGLEEAACCCYAADCEIYDQMLR